MKAIVIHGQRAEYDPKKVEEAIFVAAGRINVRRDTGTSPLFKVTVEGMRPTGRAAALQVRDRMRATLVLDYAFTGAPELLRHTVKGRICEAVRRPAFGFADAVWFVLEALGEEAGNEEGKGDLSRRDRCPARRE